MSFGDMLKSYREKRGYTQEQLAEMIGVAKTTITGYERGNREPDVAKIKKLAKALNVSGDQLLETGFEYEKTPPYSDEALKLAKDYDKLDFYGKKEVRDVANNEKARCEAEATARAALEPEKERPLSIDEQVELYRQQLLSEQEQEKQASFVKESGAG